MKQVVIKDMGLVDYEACFKAMQVFTLERDNETRDEIWFVEHPSVYTQGMNGKPEHLLNTYDIPVVQTDRGGQVTYHGPGQLVVYCLFDLKRNKLGVKQLVCLLEDCVIELLAAYGIVAEKRHGAPGVYINGKKIAALGVRVKRGCSYHGLALNLDMDLAPFNGINPCGFSGLKVTQLSEYSVKDDRNIVIGKLLPILLKQFQLQAIREQGGLDQPNSNHIAA